MSLLQDLIGLLDLAIGLYYYLIIIRVVISWINIDPRNPVVNLIYRLTEPMLGWIRQFLPRSGIDLSPIVAFLLLLFIRKYVIGALYNMMY